ncbi:hypothetical protein ABPG74_000806 [Tetrahymena malaccensis]
MSLCFVIFQINNFITLYYLFNLHDKYSVLKGIFVCFMLAQFFLFSYFKTSQSNWSIVTFCLKWNFLCYIPTVKDNISQEKQDLLISSLTYFLKLGLIYIHSLFSIVVYVKYEEGSILSLFFGSQFGFLTSTMMYELKQNYTQNNIATLRQIFNKFFFTSLLTGYASLCSERWFFYYFMIFTQMLGIALSQLKNLQSIFKFGYENDVINFNYINASVIVFIFLSYSGINFGYLHKPIDNIIGSQQEYCNFNSGLQGIILLIMIVFDLIFSNISENQLVRSILISYLMIFSHSYYLILKNIYNFFLHGPFQRKIYLDCQQIKNLSENQIYQQYFRFRPQQQQITALVKNIDLKSFRTICNILLREKDRKITFQIDAENFQQRYSYTISSMIYQNIIQIFLGEQSIASIIIEEIIKNQYYKFCFQICFFYDITPKKQQILLNQLIQNYQIIPNIIISHNQNMQELYLIKSPVYQILAFNKVIQQEMTFFKEQIIFDLYDFT